MERATSCLPLYLFSCKVEQLPAAGQGKWGPTLIWCTDSTQQQQRQHAASNVSSCTAHALLLTSVLSGVPHARRGWYSPEVQLTQERLARARRPDEEHARGRTRA